MKKNLDDQIRISNDLANSIVRGIKVKFVPKPGMGVSSPSGSDCYGYTVGEVARDGSWFTYGKNYGDERGWVKRGYGVLVTRKNANGRGGYREGYFDKGGHLRPTRMDVTHVRCSRFGELNLTGEFKEPETYLDPNF